MDRYGPNALKLARAQRRDGSGSEHWQLALKDARIHLAALTGDQSAPMAEADDEGLMVDVDRMRRR